MSPPAFRATFPGVAYQLGNVSFTNIDVFPSSNILSKDDLRCLGSNWNWRVIKIRPDSHLNNGMFFSWRSTPKNYHCQRRQRNNRSGLRKGRCFSAGDFSASYVGASGYRSKEYLLVQSLHSSSSSLSSDLSTTIPIPLFCLFTMLQEPRVALWAAGIWER